MDRTLTLYTNPMSRGRVARWMLEEIGAPYTAEIVAFGPEMKGPAYTAINPMGKVPALRHGTVTVTELPAILAYLADAFPATQLAPPTDDPARGSYFRWLFFTSGPLEYAMVNRSFGFTLKTPQERGRMGYGSYEEAVNVLDAALTGTAHLAGGRFSAADLYVAAYLDFSMMTGGIDKRPSFEAFVARHKARPAAIRAREIDDALVPKPA